MPADSPQYVTLTANTVATVNFADDANVIEVLNRDGTAEVWFTVDGTTPSVEGTGSQLCPAAIGAREIEPPTSAPTTVKLLSTGTPKVAVRVVVA